MDLREIVCEGWHWINLGQNSAQWRAVVNLVRNEMYPHVCDTVPASRILPTFRKSALIPS
jgi:hypothetical protein